MLIEQAEKNVINQAKAWSDAMDFVDALWEFGNTACHEHVGKEKFFEGLELLQQAMYAEQSEAIRKCFVFAGVGGSEAEKFSRDFLKRVFSGEYAVSDFLNKWGHYAAHKTEDKDQLLKEASEIINTWGDHEN